MTFPDHSINVAARFLQSVVVFDDRAELPPSTPAEPLSGDSQPSAAEDADAARRPAEGQFGSRPEKLNEPPDRTPVPDETGVNVKRLTDAFAEKGLICGFFQPGRDDAKEEADLFIGVAKRADIVVLDWSINRDLGERALAIIAALVDATSGGRLRLAAVYTSQGNLNVIMDELTRKLGELGKDVLRRGYSLTSSGTRVVVLAKETAVLVESAEEQRVSEDDLPQRLIREFADFTMGLVSNVALAGLAAVRSETYRILRVLDSRLDPAYVGQRLLLPIPAESEEQLVEIVASELWSVLEDRTIGDEADAARVLEWAEWQLEGDKLPLWVERDPAEARAEISALLDYGYAKGDDTVNAILSRAGWSPKDSYRAAQAFAGSEELARDSNDELAMRFTIRHQYTKPDRVLQLGVLLRSASEYLLCVQPVCDSLRIDGDRDFPFLPLVESGEDFDFILKTDDGRLTLRLERKPHQVRQFRFKADPTKRCVVAAAMGERWLFSDVEGGQYSWLARLKDAQGQHIVHRLGVEFARVALSESEWIRMPKR